MESIPLTGMDLASLGGLTLVIPAIIGGLKKLFGKAIKGKEPLIAIILSYGIGVTAKLTIEGAFNGVGWLPLLVGLFFAAVGAMITHDKVVNPILHGKETGQ